jgi:hypothetical protein
MKNSTTLFSLLYLLIGCAASTLAVAQEPESISFNRDVRPILASKCFACHGPDDDAREAELRLDTLAGATADLGGYQAIVPGRADESALVDRIEADDPDVRMPPAEANKTLTPAEIKTLRAWIAAGAKYEQHWAFVPPQRPAVPAVKDSVWPRNPIDHFVLARLEREGLAPSPEAEKYTLVRRVYLDLIGLPPSPAEADAFVRDADPKAYENLVDRLLASQHYGERWARQWLDLARYSDTNGYEKDRNRSIWPYRDWVIAALNADMPFNQFTVEQLAGDMLPHATPQQRIATGFHRNTMLNEEGGIDPLEYRFYAMVDRVATTGIVWLGLTTGCAQCHTHKYDPLTHTDYYRLMALLNNADEPDLSVPVPSLVERRRALAEQLAHLERELPQHFPPGEGEGDEPARRAKHFAEKRAAWIDAEQKSAVAWKTLRPAKTATNLPKLELLEDGSLFSSGDITKRDLFTLTFQLDDLQLEQPITALRLEALPDERLPAGGPGRCYYEGRAGDFFLSEVTAAHSENPLAFAGGTSSYGKISIGSGNADARNVFDGNGSTGWSTSGAEGEPHQLVLNFAQPLAPRGELVLTMLFERHFAASLGRFRWSATTAAGQVKAKSLPVEVEAILARDAQSWTDADRAQLDQQFARSAPELAEARKKIDELRRQIPALPTTLVVEERPADNPRATQRHHRGEWLSPKEEVTPGIPALLVPLTEKPPANRLEFAQWVVSEDNPLVARVTVDRAWGAIFGAPLVRSAGDYGTQSELPTHPDLLDWLACEFQETWSLKKLHRLIVTSATYRQSSHVSPELHERDPTNRLLARGPRFRVDAEMIRDAMLSAAGVLSPKVGGPSVYPPQPASVTALAYGNTAWPTSQGEDRYRRSLYTFSKRTAPFAAFSVFDAPSGENCTAQRDRSNTPLQSLTLLNDEMYVELARLLVKKIDLTQPAEQTAAAIFRRVLTRPPADDELALLLDFYRTQQARLAAGELKAEEIASEKGASPEQAAWVLVARAVMNLDEAVTKP